MNNLEYYELFDKWTELNEYKNAYAFADEPFDKDYFIQLIKQTFQAIKQFKNTYKNIENHIDDFKKNWDNYPKLLIELALYSADGCLDESEHFVFSASQAIVRCLLNYAISPYKVLPTDDTGELCGTFDDYGLFCPSGEDVYSEFWTQNFLYDIYSGDMTEIINLAERSLGGVE